METYRFQNWPCAVSPTWEPGGVPAKMAETTCFTRDGQSWCVESNGLEGDRPAGGRIGASLFNRLWTPGGRHDVEEMRCRTGLFYPATTLVSPERDSSWSRKMINTLSLQADFVSSPCRPWYPEMLHGSEVEIYLVTANVASGGMMSRTMPECLQPGGLSLLTRKSIFKAPHYRK
jgi:hypothetical protein